MQGKRFLHFERSEPNRKTKHMTLKRTIKTITLSLLFALAAEPVVGQDLLARQAPIDRRAKKLDSIEVKSFAERENMQSPAADLYGDEWDNTYAHRATELPDRFTIDLRHFCMPTPSRVVTSNFGARWGRQHKGLDIKVYVGDTIRAAFSGKVRIVKYNAGGYGKYIVIRHPNGLETSTGTSQSKSFMKTKWCAQANPSDWAATPAEALVRTSTSKHVCAAWPSTPPCSSTSATRM